MNNNLFHSLVLIICLLESWLKKPETEKEMLLGDAWAWRDFVNGLPGHSFPTQRNSLAYIVHPQLISWIVSESTSSRSGQRSLVRSVKAPLT